MIILLPILSHNNIKLFLWRSHIESQSRPFYPTKPPANPLFPSSGFDTDRCCVRKSEYIIHWQCSNFLKLCRLIVVVYKMLIFTFCILFNINSNRWYIFSKTDRNWFYFFQKNLCYLYYNIVIMPKNAGIIKKMHYFELLLKQVK